MAKSRYADATKAARRAAMSAHKATAAANAGSADASAQPTASAAAESARDARRDELTHVDAKGEVRMVDVSDKALRRGRRPRTCPRAGRRRARTGRLAFTYWLRPA